MPLFGVTANERKRSPLFYDTNSKTNYYTKQLNHLKSLPRNPIAFSHFPGLRNRPIFTEYIPNDSVRVSTRHSCWCWLNIVLYKRDISVTWDKDMNRNKHMFLLFHFRLNKMRQRVPRNRNSSTDRLTFLSLKYFDMGGVSREIYDFLLDTNVEIK